MKPGTRVQIKGLVKAPHYNGKLGIVTSATTTVDNRIPVKLEDDCGNILTLKAENMNDVKVEFEYTGKISVPKNVTCVQFHPSVTKVENGTLFGDWAFKDCNELKKVVFNEGLKKIGKKAFMECNKLETISFPSTLIEISNYAFYMNNMKQIVFNEGLQKIEHNSFWGMKSLESVTMSSSVKLIGRSAFDECENLSEVVLNIPRVIKYNAFRNCESLDRFKFIITSRLNAIVQSGLTDVENKMYQIPGVDRNSGSIVQWSPGNEIVVDSRAMRGGENWPQIRPVLDKINGLVVYYEVREATTLFELALWKSKIDQAADKKISDRRAHRIEVPGPVKDAIIQFLGSDDTDDCVESDGDSDDDSSSSSEDESDSDGSFTDRMLDYFEHQAGVPDPFGY
jgi:hypothetical protein